MNCESIEIVELSSDASKRTAEDPYSVHDDPISAYLDRVLSQEYFGSITIPGRRRTLLGRLLVRAGEPPAMLRDLGVARNRRQEFLRLARSGFALVIASKEEISETIRFLSTLGYRRCSCVTVSDLFHAAWGAESLRRAVDMAIKVPNNTLCIFGHDGDPAYLLRHKR